MVVLKCRRHSTTIPPSFSPGGIPLPRRGTCPDIRTRVKGYGSGKPYKPRHTPKGVYGLQGRALVRFKPGAGRQIGEPIGGSHKKAEAGAVALNKQGVMIMLNFENLNKAYISGVGKYDIPAIKPTTNVNIRELEWIPFNYAKTCKTPEGKGVHFYVDDYQFLRLWNRPDDYIYLLSKFSAVCSPDFSMYTNMPAALQIYNHYRKHWLAAYWQMHGINVIPTICWSDNESFSWCFDGDPKNSIISISSVGTQQGKLSKELFLNGCREAIKRLEPSEILWHGKCPEGLGNDVDIVTISPFYKELARRCGNGRQRS